MNTSLDIGQWKKRKKINLNTNKNADLSKTIEDPRSRKIGPSST